MCCLFIILVSIATIDLSCHQNEKRVLLSLLLLVQNTSEARHPFRHQQLLPWSVLLVLKVKWVPLVLLVRIELLLCEQVLVVVVVIILRICLQLKALVTNIWQQTTHLFHLKSLATRISQI